MIRNISEDNNTIEHLIYTEKGSSGGPLIFLSNHKVIGIHKGNKKTCNVGTFLKEPLIQFKEMYKSIHMKIFI